MPRRARGGHADPRTHPRRPARFQLRFGRGSGKKEGLSPWGAPTEDRRGTEMQPTYTAKVKTLDELVAAVRIVRRQGKRVVFTNGCFDLLHRGHVRYLDQAKALGDVLIVAINSDASVRALKGADRPVMSDGERAELVAALAAVDYVVIFEELDPGRVIQAVEPDVLVKGGDWQVDQVVGRQIVEGRGGRVMTLPYVEGASSSELLRRIRTGRG